MEKPYLKSKKFKEKYCVKENMKFLRKSTGLSLEYMAEYLGLKSKNSYRAYEIGKADPAINSLIRIAKLYDITIDDLINKNLAVTSLKKDL